MVYGLRKGYIQGYFEIFRQVDVRIETDIEPVETGIVQISVVLGVSHRKTVQGYVVSSAYVDSIVLRKGSFFDLVEPIGPVVAALVICTGRIIVEELQAVGIYIHTPYHVGGIQPECLCIHYGNGLEGRAISHIYKSFYFGGHIAASLGIDNDYSIGSFTSIDGCRVFQYSNFFYIIGFYQSQGIVGKTVDCRISIFLHLPDNAIDNEQGLCRGIQRVESSRKNRAAAPGNTRLGEYAELPVEPGCDVFVYGRNSCRETGYGIGPVGQKNGLVIKCFTVIFEDAYFYIMASFDRYNLVMESGCFYRKCHSAVGQVDSELTFFVGHGCDTGIYRTDAHPGKTLSCGIVDDSSGNGKGIFSIFPEFGNRILSGKIDCYPR